MSNQVFGNNVVGVLSGSHNSSTTVLQLVDSSMFPTLTGGDWFMATLYKVVDGVDTNIEIVKCTVNDTSLNRLLVTRNQEGSGAKSYVDGDFIAIRITAGAFSNINSKVDANTSANVTNAADIANLETGAVAAGKTGKVVEKASSSNMNVKVIDIGNWNMDASANVVVPHNLTLSKIRQVYAEIRSDTGGQLSLEYSGFTGSPAGFIFKDSTNIILYRQTGDVFDSTNYDASPYNRGWITIWYMD